MQEVTGSIPVTSTNPESPQQKSPSSRGLGHRPFTAVTGVRIPVGTPTVRGNFWARSRSESPCRRPAPDGEVPLSVPRDRHALDRLDQQLPQDLPGKGSVAPV